jgi:hypothetical protein
MLYSLPFKSLLAILKEALTPYTFRPIKFCLSLSVFYEANTIIVKTQPRNALTILNCHGFCPNIITSGF